MTGRSIATPFARVVAPDAERIEVIARDRSSGLVAATHDMPKDSFSIRCKRLLFRSWSRGTQESDLILGSFADSWLGSLDEGQLDRFEALLGCSDPDLFDWILGGGEPPVEHDHDVLRMLRAYWAPRAHGRRPSDASAATLFEANTH